MDAKRAKESWDRSAEVWIDLVNRKDVNRTVLLDGPMLEMANKVQGERVLDVGCGEGRFCRMLGCRGATTVGIDPTLRLIQEARDRDTLGSYLVAKAEELPFKPSSFDLVISYITLVDIVGYRDAINEMARVTKPGGRVLVANLQSFVTTRERAWYLNEKGEKLHVGVEEYYVERAMLLEWDGLSIYNWHRPFENYLSAFLGSGLILRAFREPRPTLADVQQHPSMIDEYKVPLFHIMLWEKPA